MFTYQKSRYAFGDKLELLPKGTRPPPRGFLAVNARKLAMIATRLAQSGDYSDVEEEREARLEMEMVKPCLKYGSLANSRPVPEVIDEAIQSQIRMAKTIRDVSVYGGTSIYSGILNSLNISFHYLKSLTKLKYILFSALTALSSYVNKPRYQPPEIPETELNPLQLLAEQKRQEQESLEARRKNRDDREPKEKITSRLSVLGDGTGSDWTDKDDGTSLATTATVATISRNDDLKIRQVIHLDSMPKSSDLQNPSDDSDTVVNSDKSGDIAMQLDLEERERLLDGSDEFSLPSETEAREDHIEDLLNQAVMDTTLEELQSLSRKRPKGLLLGKLNYILSVKIN